MTRRREFVVFDVLSDLAHFRRPYAITTALTFPAPPRTALCGLVGAILGLPKNTSLEQFRDTDAVFSVQLMRPLATGHVSINLLQTKGTPTVQGVQTFRPRAENPHTAMRYEVIRQPWYRVWFSHPELGPKLAEVLAQGTTHYTPCLGLAWMIAWFGDEMRQVRAEHVEGQTGSQEVVSPVRTADIRDVQWRDQCVYQRIRMPAEMMPSRQVTRFEEYLIETTRQAIGASLKQFWRADDGTCLSAM
jgi:CRISPR-associated protein Cas5h